VVVEDERDLDITPVTLNKIMRGTSGQQGFLVVCMHLSVLLVHHVTEKLRQVVGAHYCANVEVEVSGVRCGPRSQHI
jgi:hypothetical protein